MPTFMHNEEHTPRAFIFDCDGTILQSMGMWLGVQPRLLASYGIDTTPEDFAEFESLPVHEECEGYHRKWGVGADGAEVYERLQKLLWEGYETLVTPREGVAEFLESVRAAGIPMAVATSTPLEFVRHGLSRFDLDGYFDVMVTTGEAGASKDHPDVYNLALERLCAARGMELPAHEEVWVFEDAVFGLKSSGAADYRRVGIYDPEGRAERADVRANAEIFIDGYPELSLERIVAFGR